MTNRLGEAARLYGLRRSFGYSQSEMAEMCYVSLRTWQWWESGKRSIPLATYELLLIKLGLHNEFKKVKS
jgi:transcriptional regulator with XRE-family HTH domain